MIHAITNWRDGGLSCCFFAGQNKDGLVVQARCAHGSLDRDLFPDVHVFRPGLDAEGGVFPHAEFDAALEPGGTEAVSVGIHRQHVGDKERALEEFIDFAGRKGREAIVLVLRLFPQDHVHFLGGGDGYDDFVHHVAGNVHCPVAAPQFGDFVDEHAGGSFGAFRSVVHRDDLGGAGGKVQRFQFIPVFPDVVRGEDAAANAICLRSDFKGAGFAANAQDDFIEGALDALALFAHDVGCSKVQGVHVHLVIFRERDGAVEFALLEMTLPKVQFIPFELDLTPRVFPDVRFAVERQGDGFAGAVGVQRHVGLDQGRVLLDLRVPFGFVFGTKHFGDIGCEFHITPYGIGDREGLMLVLLIPLLMMLSGWIVLTP